MHTADALALLRACAQFPDDDTVRLVYADCLEENGEPERAEFVRVQVELARLEPIDRKFKCAHRGEQDCRFCRPLRARESALLREHEARWRAAGPCPKCCGVGKTDGIGGSIYGRDCPACFGTGDRGGLLRRFYYPTQLPSTTGQFTVEMETGTVSECELVRAVWRRGFVARVECPRLADALAEVEVTCEACDGDGGESYNTIVDCHACRGEGTVPRFAPTACLRAVLDAKAAPERALVAEVVPLDAEAQADGLRRGNIPHELWETLCRGRGQVAGLSTLCEFDSAADALSALGRAVVALARA